MPRFADADGSCSVKETRVFKAGRVFFQKPEYLVRLAQSLQFARVRSSAFVPSTSRIRVTFKRYSPAAGLSNRHTSPRGTSPHSAAFSRDQPAERPVKRAYFIPVFPNVRFEAGRIHIADTEKQRGWLHIAVLHAPKFKFYARACSNVCVAAAVDHNFGTKQKQAGFIGGYDTR